TASSRRCSRSKTPTAGRNSLFSPSPISRLLSTVQDRFMKNVNIGMIGYGFMGKAHSNAYAQASHFFPCEYRPVLKALCARNKEKAQGFANTWGYESIETDW